MDYAGNWIDRAMSVAYYLDGYEVRAPRIPGCVVRLRDAQKAMAMVREAVIAVADEREDRSDDTWSTTA